ncbi:MAG: phenylalanine--tRNA ligase beta subunit-related protein, partial [bacterium]
MQIQNKSLVPRFSAITLDNVSIQQSPKLIRERLEKVGVRAIDNVVDVTNYFMIDKGQPMHSFDYDKILGGKMIVRESMAGEGVITLDGQERKLPAGVIIIEDGHGRLIDLCGIMGAQNSEVDENTKRVLLFVQIYDPVRIRQASMALGHRTDAAMRFEKGVDSQGVVPSLWEAVGMLERNAGAVIASKLIDIVNQPYREKKLPLDIKKIQEVAGVPLPEKDIVCYLCNLCFLLSQDNKTVTVPSWRHSDIEATE